MKIGVIGLGRMGYAMASTLLRAGHEVVGWNRTRDKAEALRGAGAQLADSVGDACRGDAVITMLADDAAVESVVFAPGGVLDALAPGESVHVSASTISPTLVRGMAERHRARKQRFVSAPVLGRPDAAAQGKLFVLAAGDPDAIEAVRPVFDGLGPRTFAIGDIPERANLVKLCCNSMIATIIETVGETLALVTKAGVDQKTYIDVLLATVLGTPLYAPYAEHILKRQFQPGFRLPLALKDIELALAAGEDLAVPLQVVSVIRDHMLEAIAAGDADLDWSALSLVAQREAGLVH